MAHRRGRPGTVWGVVLASLTVLAGNRPVPAPIVFTAANAASAYAEQYEGQLVRINGLTSVNTTGGTTVSSFYNVTGVVTSWDFQFTIPVTG